VTTCDQEDFIDGLSVIWETPHFQANRFHLVRLSMALLIAEIRSEDIILEPAYNVFIVSLSHIESALSQL